MVKGLHDGDNAHCVDTASTGVSKDGDQHVLLEVERAGIHGERPVGERDLDPCGGQDGGHGSADGERQYLNANRRQGDLVLPVAQELVDEGEQDAGDEPQGPCSEGQAWQAWIVGGRHCEPYLLDGAVIVFFLCHHRSIHPQTQIIFENKIRASTLVDLNDVKKNHKKEEEGNKSTCVSKVSELIGDGTHAALSPPVPFMIPSRYLKISNCPIRIRF
ncbi:hypothetical protein BHE74_00007654 [Ensete ventricosum]|nr:hypothetical protein BHE74_00007654 [Ensete ventricosum]RZR90041.1 hypothetical protein BHM03_00017865 [Ensete ventricosum]